MIMLNMEMPKSCKKCRMTVGDAEFGKVCFFTGRPLMSKGRHDDCQLISDKREKWFKVDPSV